MKKTFNAKNETTQKEKIKKKILKNKIVRSILFASIAYLGTFSAMTHYIDNKARDIVSHEQIETLNDIISSKERNNFFSNLIQSNFYTDEMYDEDYKIFLEFQHKMKADFEELFKNDEYIRKHYKQYIGNYDLFLKEVNEEHLSHPFYVYFLNKKMENNSILKIDAVNNYDSSKYYNMVETFFNDKIRDDNRDKISYEEISKIPLIKKYSDRMGKHSFSTYISKDIFSDLFLTDRYLRNLSYNNNILSEQLDDYYVWSMIAGDYDGEYTENQLKEKVDFKNIKYPNIRNSIDNLIKDIVHKQRIRSSIFDLSEKQDVKVKNTFMLLNIKYEYIKRKNDIYTIKKENAKQFSDINYSLYHYFGKPLVVFRGFIYDENYENKSHVYNITRDEDVFLLSGFNEKLKEERPKEYSEFIIIED